MMTNQPEESKMTKPLHGTVADAYEGDWGWVWIARGERWFMAMVRDDHLEVFDGADVELDNAAALPWWPISEPPYEVGEEHEPTMLVTVMDGNGSVITGMRITDPTTITDLHRKINTVLDESREGRKG